MSDFNENNLALDAQGLRKTYESGPQQVTVWQDVNLQVAAGESIAIVGASGSGKTTLLNVLGGLDEMDDGQVAIAGQSISDLPEKERTRLRNQHIGFVYQFHHLLPEFSALENVMMPLLLGGMNRKAATVQAEASLVQMGLSHRLSHKPAELSGGERQRTAIARALVNKPRLVLMDEPTGNLDQQTAQQVENAMLELANASDTAFVMVTHDVELAKRMKRRYLLSDQTLQLMSEDD
ncbi:ABC transporter ATP-binding protein [Bacterioplanoides sp.]|uniref:ABC transporter ATP-binding protein n=1 Tax=Bacterioplanoides sp. TaxID=2066072 RepID=UPI003AFFA68B